jgi:hypothetical protein
LINTTVEVSALKRALPGLRRRSALPTGKGGAEGRDDEGRRPEIQVSPMRTGILGESAHEVDASGLRWNAGADHRRAALFLHGRREVLDSTHVEPAFGVLATIEAIISSGKRTRWMGLFGSTITSPRFNAITSR